MTYFRNKKYHQNYSHNTLFPGAVFDTRHNGKCTVLGRSEDKTRRGYYVVEFKDSGIVKEAYGAHIKSGAVSDDAFPSSEEERTTLLMKPRYYNVGYIGNGKHSTIENTRSHQRTRKFILWHNMLARCYMTSKGKQYFKGYKGVTVCEKWHNFQNFCNDLPALHGYALWKNNPGEYELDKDYYRQRIYSPDTVSFISTSDNAHEARLRASAMRIPGDRYHEINKMREELLQEAEDVIKESGIKYDVVLHGNMRVIVAETPYGTVAFYPLTHKIQRNGYMTEGDALVYVRYLRWLRCQWEGRNPGIDCIAAIS